MRKPAMIAVVSSVLVCAAPFAITEPVGSLPGPDVVQSARTSGTETAEMKGDLARIHNNYEIAVSDYLVALKVDRENAVLYNKLGIAELQLHERRAARKY